MSEPINKGIVEDVCFLTAVDLAQAIRARKISPLEVFEATAARIEAVNPMLNAYCTLDLDRAREAARQAEAEVMRATTPRPLLGVPIAVKDDLPVAGLRWTEGSQLFGERVAHEDGRAVGRLRRAGAVVLGKTNLPEFGHKGTTDNLVFGATLNPWDRRGRPVVRAAVQPRAWPRGWPTWAWGPISGGRYASRPVSAASSASSPRLGG